jgi:hypothetical protein
MCYLGRTAYCDAPTGRVQKFRADHEQLFN